VHDFVLNPRRSPRLPARCRVTVAHGGAGWVAETEDVGPRGCQIVSQRPLEAGGVARLIIESARVATPLSVVGRIAWTAGEGRHRAGVAYAERQSGVDPASWFKKLLVTQPAMEGVIRRVPERLTCDTKLFLRPPPQHIFDFSPDEVRVLKLLGDGTSVGSLLARGPLAEPEAARVIFALLERRVLTLSLGEAAPAWRWKAAIAELEMQGTVTRLPQRARDVQTPRPWIPPKVDSVLRTAAARPAPAAAAAAYASQSAAQAPAPRPAEAAPPALARARPAEAQECFDRAVSAVSSGEISGAIALLRRALALSPRDPEVAALLGQLAFRDRGSPDR